VQGFEMSVPMLGVYYNSPSDTPEDGLVWEIGFTVPDSLEVTTPLVVKKWTFTKVAKAMHIGRLKQQIKPIPKFSNLLTNRT